MNKPPEYNLKDWAISHINGEYTSTDTPNIRMSGVRSIDDIRIISSPVRHTNGREIQTESGTIYHLIGPPEEEYIDWLAQNRLNIDPNNPIKTKNRFNFFVDEDDFLVLDEALADLIERSNEQKELLGRSTPAIDKKIKTARELLKKLREI